MNLFDRPLRAILIAIVAASICGCGGNSSLAPALPHISVSLSNPSVTVPQTGMEVIVPINIASPSETAIVAVTGLPGGIQQGYSASDTSPSGILTFVGGPATPLGTYMPVITVQSAGAMASTQFTLTVTTAGH